MLLVESVENYVEKTAKIRQTPASLRLGFVFDFLGGRCITKTPLNTRPHQKLLISPKKQSHF